MKAKLKKFSGIIAVCIAAMILVASIGAVLTAAAGDGTGAEAAIETAAEGTVDAASAGESAEAATGEGTDDGAAIDDGAATDDGAAIEAAAGAAEGAGETEAAGETTETDGGEATGIGDATEAGQIIESATETASNSELDLPESSSTDLPDEYTDEIKKSEDSEEVNDVRDIVDADGSSAAKDVLDAEGVSGAEETVDIVSDDDAEVTEDSDGASDIEAAEGSAGSDSEESAPVMIPPLARATATADAGVWASGGLMGVSYNAVLEGRNIYNHFNWYKLGEEDAFCVQFGYLYSTDDKYYYEEKLTGDVADMIGRVMYLMENKASDYDLDSTESRWVIQRYIWECDPFGNSLESGTWRIEYHDGLADEKYASIISDAKNLSYISGALYHYVAGSEVQDLAKVVYWESYGKLQISAEAEYTPGSVTVTKKAQGSDSDADAEFSFTATFYKGSTPLKNVKLGSYTTNSSGKINFSLANAETASFTGVPQGYSYTITETEDTRYKTTASASGGGSASGYKASGTIPGPGSGQSFTFTVNLKDPAGNNAAGWDLGNGLTTNSSGNVTFKLTPDGTSASTLTLEGLPAGYSYTVTETSVTKWPETSGSLKRTGKVTGDQTKSAAFANKYTADGMSHSFTYTNVRKPSSLVITKTTSSANVTSQLKDNRLYSSNFSGAEFKVSVTDSNTGKTSVKTYTTDSTGKIQITDLWAGDTVVVTEVTPPAGYGLSKSPSSGKIVLDSTGTSLSFANAPLMADAGLEIIKTNAVTSAPIEGAIFKVEYLDSLDVANAATCCVWYFQTDSQGKWSYGESTPLSTSTYKSSARYTGADGKYAMPLGMYRVTEVYAPEGFLIDKTSRWYVVSEGADGSAAGKWTTGTSKVVETPLDIAVRKVDRGTGESVVGASLLLRDLTDKKDVYTWTSDGTEKLITGVLVAGHSYRICETAAPEGYKLMDAIDFTVEDDGTITLSDISTEYDYASYTDSSRCDDPEEGRYLCVYATDVRKIYLPVTGSSDGLIMLIAGAGLIALSGGAFALMRRERSKKVTGPAPGSRAQMTTERCLLAAVLAALLAVCGASTVMADGNICVVSKNAEANAAGASAENGISDENMEAVETAGNHYTAYLIATGIYDDGSLLKVHLNDDIPDSVWRAAGISCNEKTAEGLPEGEYNTDGEVIKCLKKQVDKDYLGTFMNAFADLVEESGAKPAAEFASGETVTVCDGLYLITTEGSYPMLVAVGGGNTQKIYEKTIGHLPVTGDLENMTLYIWVALLGVVTVAVLIVLRLRNRRGTR